MRAGECSWQAELHPWSGGAKRDVSPAESQKPSAMIPESMNKNSLLRCFCNWLKYVTNKLNTIFKK